MGFIRIIVEAVFFFSWLRESRSNHEAEDFANPTFSICPHNRSELHPQTLPAVDIPPPLQDALRMRQVTGL